MTYRSRAALAVVFATAGLALPAAGPARADTCVKVVVDYGTMSGAPGAPNTHCVSASDGTLAYQVLARRASTLGAQQPRYNGNFLCAIDGYPESGCGDHGTEPYWSFWIWRNGRWTYSSAGVDSYQVSDTDSDGHPDPLGFRYHAFESKQAPRPGAGFPAAKPSARPSTARPTTAAPSRATSGTTGGTSGPTSGGTTGGTSGGAATQGPSIRTTGPSPAPPAVVTAAPSAGPVGATATAPVDPGAGPSARAGATAEAAGPTTPPGIVAKKMTHVPVGTILAALAAAGLLGAAVWRSRRPGTS